MARSVRWLPSSTTSPGPERSFQHLYFNANKRSLTLDLETAEGVEELRRLAVDADILIECGQPGSLDAEALHQLNPHLIIISATPYGQRGPKRHWRASDLTASAAGGFCRSAASARIRRRADRLTSRTR